MKNKKADLENLVKYLIWIGVIIIGLLAINFGYKLIKMLIR